MQRNPLVPAAGNTLAMNHNLNHYFIHLFAGNKYKTNTSGSSAAAGSSAAGSSLTAAAVTCLLSAHAATGRCTQ